MFFVICRFINNSYNVFDHMVALEWNCNVLLYIKKYVNKSGEPISKVPPEDSE